MKDKYEILVVGGGTAGLTVAARLLKQSNPPEVAIIEPSDKHYYQPIWTLVGGGVVPLEVSRRDEADYIPPGATWIKDAVSAFQPDDNTLTTRGGRTIGYDYLVVCPGIQLDWDAIPGLKETIGRNGVCSNYAYDQASYTWECLQNVKNGPALFTTPATPIKCGGAPQKIMYLAADYLRKQGLLRKGMVRFFSPGTVIFGVEDFARTLRKVIERYGIEVSLFTELIALDGPNKLATFRRAEGDGSPVEETISFEMIHVTPPQSAPDFIKSSPLAGEGGWVAVDRGTLQHVRYPNVFGLGDATSTPNAKTGAAVRKQAPTVVHNLMEYRETGAITAPKIYNGYSSCPLVTGYGKLVLAEFDYDNNPDPSFPFDTTKERYSMYALKLHALPQMYWHGMLKGRA